MGAVSGYVRLVANVPEPILYDDGNFCWDSTEAVRNAEYGDDDGFMYSRIRSNVTKQIVSRTYCIWKRNGVVEWPPIR